MNETNKEQTQEEANDKTGPATGNPAKAWKNKMHAWVRARVDSGKVSKSRAIEEAEKQFQIPYRTGGKASEGGQHTEQPEPHPGDPTAESEEGEDDDDDGDTSHSCAQCDKVYKTAIWLENHVKDKHPS